MILIIMMGKKENDLVNEEIIRMILIMIVDDERKVSVSS
jgi:hypothetical protein